MAENSAGGGGDYPTIDPSTFDLIVSGTGLPESLLAAAAAAAGKTVLHVDSNPFYGSHFSTLSPESLPSFLQSQPAVPLSSSSDDLVPLQTRPLYSEIDVSGPPPDRSRDFLLDLAGPRLLYCTDPAVDLMLRSGASHHVEFKSIDGSLFYWEGRLYPVPDSRQAIFKDRSLGLVEKNKMMRFLKLVRAHFGAEGGDGVGEIGIPAEDLEISFAEFLQKHGLSPKIRMIILYGIALADYDQENTDSCGKLLKTKEGLESLALYSSSLGRPFLARLPWPYKENFLSLLKPGISIHGMIVMTQTFLRTNHENEAFPDPVTHNLVVNIPSHAKELLTVKEASNPEPFDSEWSRPRICFQKCKAAAVHVWGAFIYPIYGHGELSQAFCRCAAVKGALYVLRMPAVALLVDKENSQYKGVRLGSGQDILSHHLVIDPSFSVPLSITPTNFPSEDFSSSKSTRKVARAVCITNASVQNDLSNILVVFPPRSLNSEHLTTVRALQMSSNVAVCPSGRFVVYLSTPCDNARFGKELIHAAMNALFVGADLSNSEGSTSTDNVEGLEGESKPTLIWSCSYVQELIQGSSGAICSCPMPDEKVDYRNLMESTMKTFTSMYPEEEYFPKTPASENTEEDSGLVE